ncbi:putative quinol monooxygenase [Sphingomonas sanxanigenens]|nr:putative quinol monooxygenase [Sphingomonas sanxanigenens]
MSHPVKITATLTALPDRAGALQALLTDMAPHCRAEPGNLRWDVWQDQAQPGRYVLDELYVDGDAVAAHRQSPHYLHYLSRVPDLAERTALVCDPVAVDHGTGA